MKHLKISVLPLLLAALLGVSGCGWQGDGEEVAAAILATSQVETRSFKGSLKMTTAGNKNGAASTTEMTFSGRIDTRDDANPKMAVDMNAAGETTSIMVPGDGKLYLTVGGTSYVIPVPVEQAQTTTVDPGKIYAALGEAVDDFQASDPMENALGKKVQTRTAVVSRKQLCGDVIEAFGDALTRASGLGGQLGGGSGDNEQLKKMCKSMVKRDPRVWFGLENGRLTDVVLSAKLKVPLVGTMSVELAYHEYNQDGDQGEFEAPAGAVPLPSLDQLGGSLGS